ncbi:MAG: hypothetical protein ACI8PT_000331 [Gammaproteobacteria bacterium]|jgi:hypothetical protein
MRTHEALTRLMFERVQLSARRQLVLLPHAIRQMARPDRMISATEVRSVIATGEVIDDYPEAARVEAVSLSAMGTMVVRFMWFARQNKSILR